MKNNDCKEIERLLIYSNFESISPEIQSNVIQHVQTCDNCRKSELILQAIGKVMKLEYTTSSLEPNPEIKQSLLREMINNRKPNPFSKIGDFLNIRIPLYQPLAAALVILADDPTIVFHIAEFLRTHFGGLRRPADLLTKRTFVWLCQRLSNAL